MEYERGPHLQCPVCRADLKDRSEILRAVHVNTCIDHATKEAQKVKKDEPPKKDEEEPKAQDHNDDEIMEIKDPEEYVPLIPETPKNSKSNRKRPAEKPADTEPQKSARKVADLGIRSPIDAEIQPSAHKDMDDMLKLINESNHYVYGLWLLNPDGTLNHCFYVGESSSPQDRLVKHRSDIESNSDKWAYFEKYGRARIRIIIFHKGTMGACMVLEKLLIQNGHQLLNFQLTNVREGDNVELDCDVVAGLQQLVDIAIDKNEGFNADTVKFSPKETSRLKKYNHKRYLSVKASRKSIQIEALGLAVPSTSTTPSSSDTSNVELNIPTIPIGEDTVAAHMVKLRKSYDFTGGKTQLVAPTSILDPATLVGTFKAMTEDVLEVLVHDETSAVAFATRVGLIPNVLKCPKCNIRDMKVTNDLSTGRWMWRCKYYDGKRISCSSQPVLEGSILKQNRLTAASFIKMLYHLARGLTHEQILRKFPSDFPVKTLLLSVASSIRNQVLDVNLLASSSNKNASAEALQHLFLTNDSIDHFGLLLSWLKPSS